MLVLPDLGLNIALLQAKPFPHLSNKLINLLLVRKSLGHRLYLQAPLSPCNNLGVLCLHVEFSKGLNCIEPRVEGDKRKVHKPKCFTPKVRLVAKLSFQYLEDFKEFLLACLFFFSFCGPYLPWNFINLHIPHILLPIPTYYITSMNNDIDSSEFQIKSTLLETLAKVEGPYKMLLIAGH